MTRLGDSRSGFLTGVLAAALSSLPCVGTVASPVPGQTGALPLRGPGGERGEKEASEAGVQG